jgi:hypothetical protein
MGGCLGLITFFVVLVFTIYNSFPPVLGFIIPIVSGFTIWYAVEHKAIKSDINSSQAFGGVFGFIVGLIIFFGAGYLGLNVLLSFILAVLCCVLIGATISAPAVQNESEEERRYEQSVRNFQEGEEQRIARALVRHLEHLYGEDGGWQPVFKEDNVYDEDNPDRVLFRCQKVMIAGHFPGSKRNKYWRANLLKYEETEYKGNRDRCWLDKDGDRWMEIDFNPDFSLCCMLKDSNKSIDAFSVPGGWSIPKIGYLPGNQVFSTPYQVKLAALYNRY